MMLLHRVTAQSRSHETAHDVQQFHVYFVSSPNEMGRSDRNGGLVAGGWIVRNVLKRFVVSARITWTRMRALVINENKNNGQWPNEAAWNRRSAVHKLGEMQTSVYAAACIEHI